MTTPTQQPLSRALIAARNIIRRRQLVWTCATGAGALGAATILADVLNRITPMRESVLFAVLAGLAGAAAVWLLVQVSRILVNAPSAVDVALAVERARPEFMDAVVCAVEIENEATADRGRIAAALLDDVQTQTADFDFLASVFPAHLRLRRLLVPVTLFAGIVLIAVRTEAVAKARFFFRDWRGGTNSGLVVRPGNREAAEHADVTVTAEVLRWAGDAEIQFVADGPGRFVMNRDSKDSFFFTFYDLQTPVRYRVLTPSLASAWFTLTPYTPPAVLGAAIHIEPPAYTGNEPTELAELRNCSAVVGSTITIELKVPGGVQATLETDEGANAFEEAGTAERRHQLVLQDDLSFAVLLADSNGRTTRTPTVTIKAEPDLPPVVDALRPRKDTKVRPAGKVDLEARASDDFGLGRVALCYSISGAPQKEMALFQFPEPGADGEKSPENVVDRTVLHTLDAAAMKLRAGDVVSYFFKACDRRVPSPQVTRTELFFIEVRPDIKPEKKDGSGKKREMDVSKLIAESKRLLRLTWDTQAAADDERADLAAELLRSLKDLHVEAKRKLNEILEAGKGPSELSRLMASAADDIGKAEVLVTRSLIPESLAPQGRALSKLVTLENELMKNAAESKQGQGEGEKGQQQKEQQKKREASPRERQERLQALRNMLDALRRLEARQDRLNQRVGREAEQQTAGARAGMLAESQQELREDTEALTATVDKLPEAAGATRGMQSASSEMERGATALTSDALRMAQRHGQRAHNYLSSAARSLEDAYRRASANELQRLAGMAQQLADVQRGAADKSRAFADAKETDRAKADAARQEQDKIKAASSQLLTAVERGAGEMEEMYPDAARAMVTATQETRKANPGAKMTRAANALLYRRFSRARTYQVDAANALQSLASMLSDATKLLPAMSREELFAELQKLRQQGQRIQQAQNAGDRKADLLEQIRQQVSQQVDRLATTMQDQALQRVGDELAFGMAGDNAGKGSQRLLTLVKTAASVLEKHLFAAEVQRRLSLSRQTSTPPAKYRKLVEQYFKDLSRTK